MAKKTDKRKTIKPNDSSWIVWMVSTIILVGVFVAQFIWGTEFTNTIMVVYTPSWFIISVLYMVGRIARQKITTSSLLKLIDMAKSGDSSGIANFLMHKDEEKEC